jgi:hypothetical protein
VWIIRDFYLTTLNHSAKEYMENVLHSGSKRAQELMDKTREAVTSVFKDRNCITLPTPMEEVRDIQRLDEIPEDQLRPDFRT